MIADWIPIKYLPIEPGPYLVTTCKGAVIIDRWDGDGWALCQPRIFSKYPDKGRYKPHRAWSYLPPGYEEDKK